VFTFYLGVHRPNWLGELDVPLFVSRTTLSALKHKYPRASARWALDSGGFTELHRHGKWTVTPAEYVAEVRRYSQEIGMMEWAAPQDWMVEPRARRKTGFTTIEHQQATCANFVELRALAPDLPIIPVIQGWKAQDYLRHVEIYDQLWGVDLFAEPLVGVGSVCRREGGWSFMNVASVLRSLAKRGLRMHGFGLSKAALHSLCGSLASSDSMAWSASGRDRSRRGGESNLQNSPEYALGWRMGLLNDLAQKGGLHQEGCEVAFR